MGMNLLADWWVFKYFGGVERLLFLDDDVIVR